MFRRTLLLLFVISLWATCPCNAQTDFSWQNCGLGNASVQVTDLKIAPDPPQTPAPLALTASIDATARKITDLHAYVMFGPFALYLDSGPVSFDFDRGFVSLPAAIPMPTLLLTGQDAAPPVPSDTCPILEPYKLPCKPPVKANSYGTPVGTVVPFIFVDGPSLATVETSGFTKVDLTSTNLFSPGGSGSLSLSFNGKSGFPAPVAPPQLLPPPPPDPGDFAAEVELLGADSQPLGCLALKLGISFVQCVETVSASPNVLRPANGQMSPVMVRIESSHACTPGACAITSVTSNVPPGTDAVASGDARITGAYTLDLKAQSALTYTVTLTCLDAFGDPGTKSVTVSGPSL